MIFEFVIVHRDGRIWFEPHQAAVDEQLKIHGTANVVVYKKV